MEIDRRAGRAREEHTGPMDHFQVMASLGEHIPRSPSRQKLYLSKLYKYICLHSLFNATHCDSFRGEPDCRALYIFSKNKLYELA